MRLRPKAGAVSVERGLDIAFLAALAIGCAVPVTDLVRGRPREAAVSAALVALLGLVWWWRSTGAPRARVALGLGCGLVAIGALPNTSPVVLFLLLVVPLVVAFDLGLWAGVLLGVLAGAAFWLDAVLYRGLGPVEAIAQNLGLSVVMALVAGFGATMRATERARAEAQSLGEELARANDALRRSLSMERELVLAEERARSARELHDGLGHRLTLVGLSLQVAQRTRDRAPDQAWAEVDVAARSNHEALEDMRMWVRALDPPVALDGVGGPAAFEAIAQTFRGTGLDVRVGHRGEERPLGREVSLFATRFIQESLTNVLRHSGAGRVEIGVVQSPQQVRISVADDGVGASGTAEGFGRRSLRERVELLGGSLTSGRSQLGGFEIAAVVPLHEGE